MQQQMAAETGIKPKRQHPWPLGGPFIWLSPRHLRFWLLVAVVLYTLAGFFPAPWLIERAAVKTVSEAGRSLKLGAVKVNPFALSVTLRDLELRDTDGEVIFAFDEGYLNFQLSSLYHWAWTFSNFRLVQPYLNMERFRPGNDRISNLVNALAPGAAAGAEDARTSADLPRLIIRQLEWSNGRVGFTDHLQDREFKAESGPIHIKANDLSTLPDQAGNQQVSIATRSGGKIGWSGTLQLTPLLSQGRLTISGQGLADARRYLNLFLPFTAQAGDVDITLDYRITMERPGGLDLKVENLAGEASDIRIQLADTGSELVQLPQVRFTGGALHWLEKKVSLESLTIDNAQLNIARLPDGEMDLQRLLPAPQNTSTQSDSSDDSASGEWTAELQQLLVSGAAVRFEDRSLEPAGTVSVHKLTLSASGISNRSDAAFPTHLEFELIEGGTFKFDGEAKALPAFFAAGGVTIDGASLAIAQPWIADVTHVAVRSGTASFEGQILHGPEETASFQGSAHVDGFELQDTNRNEPLLGLDLLDIERIEFSLENRSLETSQLKLIHPYGRFAIAPDRTTNLKGLMVESQATETQPDTELEKKPLAITLDGFEIKDASLDFSDRSLPLPFAAAIRSLGGTVSTLSNTSSEPAQVQLEGQVNEYGLARISGSINAWSPTAHSDLKVIFRNLETARLSPYTIGFSGYKIEDGRLDLDLDYQIKQGKMLGTNKIVSRQLKLGDKVESPGGASLPLQLAVALLTDSNGVIDVDLPVSGDINDPEFRLGGVIAKAIAGLIGKIVTAPFRLLGMLVGVDSEDFGSVRFVPGSAGISPPDREKLVKLAEAMQQRPDLELEVAGVYAADRDRAALQSLQLDAELEARTEAQKQGSKELSSVLRRRITEALFEQTFPDIALEAAQAEYMREMANDDASPTQPALDETAYLAGLRQRLVEQQQVADQQLIDLANARADAVLAVLQDSGNGANLSLNRAEAEAAKATTSGEIPLELKVSVADRAR